MQNYGGAKVIMVFLNIEFSILGEIIYKHFMHITLKYLINNIYEELFHRTIDESIEHLKCITKHGNFSAMTNKTVLLQVGPLLRDKNGKGYRRRDGQAENQ